LTARGTADCGLFAIKLHLSRTSRFPRDSLKDAYIDEKVALVLRPNSIRVWNDKFSALMGVAFCRKIDSSETLAYLLESTADSYFGEPQHGDGILVRHSPATTYCDCKSPVGQWFSVICGFRSPSERNPRGELNLARGITSGQLSQVTEACATQKLLGRDQG
jgi:hypothetical protein